MGKWGGTLHKVFSPRARGDTWCEKETPVGAIYTSFYALMGARTKRQLDWQVRDCTMTVFQKTKVGKLERIRIVSGR